MEAIDATGALEELPYRLAVRRNDPFGGLLAARWPLLEQHVVSSTAGRSFSEPRWRPRAARSG